MLKIATLVSNPPPSKTRDSGEEVEGAQEDHNRLVRELDVLMCGEEGAAKQASLCDIVSQFPKWKLQLEERARREGAREERERIKQVWEQARLEYASKSLWREMTTVDHFYFLLNGGEVK